MGSVFSIAFVESGFPFFGFVCSGWLFFSSVFRLVFGMNRGLLQIPLFLWCFAVMNIFGLCTYYYLIGSFQQPSELGGIIHLLTNQLTKIAPHLFPSQTKIEL